jgi:ADP-ribose pyrophosphatase YjhB (NUDIX family)
MTSSTETEEFARPIVTVDVALFTVIDGKLQVALYPRKTEPFKGVDTIVGTFIRVDEDETAEAAAQRVLEKKAGLTDVYFEQLQTFSGSTRDPRGWSVSIAYIALVPAATLRAGHDGLSFRPVDEISGLPFDHDLILKTAVSRLRGKGAYSVLPCHLLEAPFTYTEMIEAYETVIGAKIDNSSFRRKVGDLGFVKESDMERVRPLSGKRRPVLLELAGDVATFDRSL